MKEKKTPNEINYYNISKRVVTGHTIAIYINNIYIYPNFRVIHIFTPGGRSNAYMGNAAKSVSNTSMVLSPKSRQPGKEGDDYRPLQEREYRNDLFTAMKDLCKYTECMRGSRKFCQRVSNFDNLLLVVAGREDPNTTISGQSSALQRNAIQMAFRWRADDSTTLNAGLVAL